MRNLFFVLFICLLINFSFAGSNQWTPCTTGITPGLFGTHAIAISPSNPQIIYISGGSGHDIYTELYKSIDGGNSWSFVTSLGVFIRSIIVDQYSDMTVYLGTQGKGFLKSVDGGNSFFVSTTGLINSTSVYPLTIDPINSNILYSGGLLSKSTDGGQSWSLQTVGISMGVNYIAVDPTDSQIVYCVDDYWAYKSINGGTSWSIITNGLSISAPRNSGLAIDFINAQVIYLAKSTGGLPFFYKSTNGGTTWTVMTSGLNRSDLNCIYIHPTDHNTIFVGTGGGVYRTMDGTSIWTAFNNFGFNSQTVFGLAMTLLSTTTIFATTGATANKSPWCYSFVSTGVTDKEWKHLDSKSPSTSNSSIPIAPIASHFP